MTCSYTYQIMTDMRMVLKVLNLSITDLNPGRVRSVALGCLVTVYLEHRSDNVMLHLSSS